MNTPAFAARRSLPRSKQLTQDDLEEWFKAAGKAVDEARYISSPSPTPVPSPLKRKRP